MFAKLDRWREWLEQVTLCPFRSLFMPTIEQRHISGQASADKKSANVTNNTINGLPSLEPKTGLPHGFNMVYESMNVASASAD